MPPKEVFSTKHQGFLEFVSEVGEVIHVQPFDVAGGVIVIIVDEAAFDKKAVGIVEVNSGGGFGPQAPIGLTIKVRYPGGLLAQVNMVVRLVAKIGG